MPSVAVRFAEAADMAAVCEIINHYIAATTFNFRTSPQTPDEWIADWTQYDTRYPWLVATRDERVVGIAYATPWKARAAYDWCAEVTVYVAHDCARQGVGRLLYERLFPLLDQQGYHTQVAAIALPNDPSVGVHEAFGFRHVGTLREVGYKQGGWRDVGFWQRRTGSSTQPAAAILPVPQLGA
ncbi:MAG: N-acetyltransferase [Planctomycetes bacterium]|nr:N-acetyltransferase [Planctomycetota bacterium]